MLGLRFFAAQTPSPTSPGPSLAPAVVVAVAAVVVVVVVVVVVGKEDATAQHDTQCQQHAHCTRGVAPDSHTFDRRRLLGAVDCRFAVLSALRAHTKHPYEPDSL